MPIPTIHPATLRHQIESVGYAVLPSVFTDAELARMRALLDAEHAASGVPSLAGWGYGCHPLIGRIPEFSQYIRHPTLVAAFAAVFGEPVRLAHSGARLASHESLSYIDWHHHYGWSDTTALATRQRCERILFNLYLDGSDPGIGSLVVHPRRLNDPLDRLHAPADAAWPGQTDVVLAPGQAVVFDTALWHSARAGTTPGRRRLWGGHIMPLSDRRPHVEDNGAETLCMRPLPELQTISV
jgi:hypothetical protein